MTDACSLQNLFLKARVSAEGAELVEFRTLSGLPLIWNGDPAWWPRHAPTLFPIVGRLAGDTLRHHGRDFRLLQHGFARDRRFELVSHSREGCVWKLRDDEESRSRYPFPFELRVGYRLDGWSLRISYEVRNPGPTPLPASLGAHPALPWPLVPGVAREEHQLRFELPEAAPIRRLDHGLLDTEPRPTPVKERTLALNDALFAEDALIFDQLRSRKLRYEAPGAPVMELSWEGFRELGVWTKPGAPFLCLEPWHGTASPAGWSGEFSEKPGIFVVPPRETRRFAYTLSLLLDI